MRELAGRAHKRMMDVRRVAGALRTVAHRPPTQHRLWRSGHRWAAQINSTHARLRSTWSSDATRTEVSSTGPTADTHSQQTKALTEWKGLMPSLGILLGD